MDTLHSVSKIIENDRSVIEAELTRLLQDKKFSGAPQMSAFLKYIVTQTLEGNGDRIKAYTVGVDALGKPYTFDAQTDPSVRVLALRLRKTLAAIYETDIECHAQVVLKVGTYVPEFYKPVIESAPLVVVADVQGDATKESKGQGDSLTVSAKLPPAASTAGGSQTGESRAEQPQSNAVDSVFRLASDAIARDASKPLVVTAVLILLLFIWLISGAHKTTYAYKLSAVMSSPGAKNAMPARVSAESQSIPTLYFIDVAGQSRHLQQISMLVGSSAVQSGHLNVVRLSEEAVLPASSFSDYQMVLNELSVDKQSRIVAQVLRMSSGAIIASSTIHIDNSTASFTNDEVSRFESLARSLYDASGPLFQDFCLRQSTAQISSKCRFDEARQRTILALGSNAG